MRGKSPGEPGAPGIPDPSPKYNVITSHPPNHPTENVYELDDEQIVSHRASSVVNQCSFYKYLFTYVDICM